jgi:hypothetical protein
MKLNSPKKIGIACFLLGILFGATIFFVWGASNPNFPTYIGSGTGTGQAGFTFFVDGSGTNFAKNGLTGQVISDTNFTNLILTAQNNLPSDGGSLFLKPGAYYGHIAIIRDGITLEGETVWNDVPEGIPDNSPTILNGSVIHPESGYDGIHIYGQKYGIVIENLGIQFDNSPTGNGISTDMTPNIYTVTHCTISNIKVLNCDHLHYAIQLENFLDVQCSQVMAWGGPLTNLYVNHETFYCGNSVFQQMYGYVKYDLGPIVLADGPYPIFIHHNDTYPDSVIGLMEFTRVQINNPTHQTDEADYYEMFVANCRYSSFRNMDLEGVESGKIRLGNNLGLTFVNAYTWAMTPANAYLNVAASNKDITFMGCYLNNILDSNYTDTYTACTIVGTIDYDSTANFVDLPGNAGWTRINQGTSSKTVNATFIGANYGVLVTQQYGYDFNINDTIIVKSVIQSTINHYNTITIGTETGLQASENIDVYWKVFSEITPTSNY